MAKKTSADQTSSSGSAKKRRTPGVSRKVIGKTSAAYERKGGADEDGEEKKQSRAETSVEQEKADAKAEKAEREKAERAEREKAEREKAERAEREKAERAEREKASVATGSEDDEQPATRAAGSAGERAPVAAEAPARAQPGAQDGAYEPAPAMDPAAEVADLWPADFIGRWDPDAPAPPPAQAPPGDSRSFRRWRDGIEEFVLIYRSGTYLVRRAGLVGRMGAWDVTEYPNVGSAAHAYAQECSELTGAGYRDLR